MMRRRETGSANIISIAQLLGGEQMPRPRFQNPTICKTPGENATWYIRPWVDIIKDGKPDRSRKTITVGAVDTMGKREAIAKKNAIMATINRSDYVLQSQTNFGDFLDQYIRAYVRREGILAASTRAKYLTHIKNHIRPAFESRMLCEITTPLIESWLDDKALSRRVGEGDQARTLPGLSWAARTDLRNILSGIFTKAEDWGFWNDRNPVERVTVGRQVFAREKRKLTEDQQARILSGLPEDVCLIIETALFCLLRISEVLGLQEKHLDFEAEVIRVRQRFYRGDLDRPKNGKPRDVPMGDLAGRLRTRLTGNPDAFVFRVETKPRWGRERAICRDDRDIHQHFLRPVAEKLGLYWKGFGFHAFRREGVTATAARLGIAQAMRMAGHSKADMTLLYTLEDREAQQAAVEERQKRMRAKVARA
jgi:integrase